MWLLHILSFVSSYIWVMSPKWFSLLHVSEPLKKVILCSGFCSNSSLSLNKAWSVMGFYRFGDRRFFFDLFLLFLLCPQCKEKTLNIEWCLYLCYSHERAEQLSNLVLCLPPCLKYSRNPFLIFPLTLAKWGRYIVYSQRWSILGGVGLLGGILEVRPAELSGFEYSPVETFKHASFVMCFRQHYLDLMSSTWIHKDGENPTCSSVQLLSSVKLVLALVSSYPVRVFQFSFNTPFSRISRVQASLDDRIFPTQPGVAAVYSVSHSHTYPPAWMLQYIDTYCTRKNKEYISVLWAVCSCINWHYSLFFSTQCYNVQIIMKLLSRQLDLVTETKSTFAFVCCLWLNCWTICCLVLGDQPHLLYLLKAPPNKTTTKSVQLWHLVWHPLCTILMW